MTPVTSFQPRQLSAAQYVLALHQPEDRVAVLVRNRARAQTIQRILLAEDIASPHFQDWLKEQNNAGADIFLGMNPFGPTASREPRRAFAKFVMSTSISTRMRQRRCVPYKRTATHPFPTSFWIPRPKRTRWSGAWTASTGNRPKFSISRRHRGHRHCACSAHAWIRQPQVKRGICRARNPTVRCDLPPARFHDSRRFAQGGRFTRPARMSACCLA